MERAEQRGVLTAARVCYALGGGLTGVFLAVRLGAFLVQAR